MIGLLDIPTLCSQWVHSGEEDTSTETVYRRVGYLFPPSRGRSSLVFHRDGTLKQIGIGPTDISVVKEGTWWIEQQGNGRIQIDINNIPEELIVQSLEGDRLVISKNK